MRIDVDPVVLDECGARLQDTATELDRTSRACASVTLSTAAFGLMNAAMVPPITDLADSAAGLIGAAGALADEVGRVARVQAEVWRDVEQQIQDDLAAIQAALEDILIGTVIKPLYVEG